MSSKKPETLQTIDPTQLAGVSGGAGPSTEDNTAVMTALSGILDSISSLAKSKQSSGFGTNEMMLVMMMMQSRSQPVAAAPAPTNWTWDANGGYWIVK
jgi:hypothetical protein